MAGIKSMGTALAHNTGTTETPVWATIANLSSIGEIGVETGEIDVTTLDSPSGFKEFISGTKDAGSCDIAGNVVTDADVVALYALANSGDTKEWKITFPSGATWEFDAYVAKFKEKESTTDSLRGFSSSLRISGVPTYTPEA